MDEEVNRTTISVYIAKKQLQRYIGVSLYRRINHDASASSTNSDNLPSYRLELIDFIDNEQFSNFDALLIQVGSCKLCVSEEYQDISKGDGKKLHNIMQSKNIEVLYMKKSFFTRKPDTSSRIEKLCGSISHAATVADKERPYAFQSIDCLLHMINASETEDVQGKYEVTLGSLVTYMRLDSAAADAINLLPKPDHPSVYGSIFGVLNRCKTKMGSRLLERWLRQPLLDYDEINRRLDVVEVLKTSTSLRNQLTNEILRSIPDLETVVTRYSVVPNIPSSIVMVVIDVGCRRRMPA
jgi:DNA mismatch repair protein MSH2